MPAAFSITAPPRRPGLRLGRFPADLALAATLLAALALAWTDGIPGSGTVDAISPTAMYLDPVAGYTDGLHTRLAPLSFPSPPPGPAVPNARPVAILIPTLNVHRPVEAVAVDRWGYMYTPSNHWDAGWYQAGPVPGAPGDAVLEGHAGYPSKPLLFGKLQQLHRGDQIIVVLADGSRQLFKVQSYKVWPAGSVPAGMGQPYGMPRLTLITCTGPFDEHFKTYADRLILEATYSGLA